MPEENQNNREPVWELHIRPMFRLIDHEHMSWLDLWDYDTVWAKREAILGRVSDKSAPMPSYPTGGPWPDEWVSIFRRWIENGGHKLDLGSPDSAGYEVKKTFDGVKISAWVQVPGEGYRAWLDIESVGATTRQYSLVLEAPLGEPSGPSTELEVRDEFKTGSVEKLIVIDADGRHEFDVPS